MELRRVRDAGRVKAAGDIPEVSGGEEVDGVRG